MLVLVLAAGAAPVVAVVRLAAVPGVLVLEVAVLDVPLLPSCLVGLLTGLLKPLRPFLAAGVGLAVPITALALLFGAASCFFSPFAPTLILEGRGLAAPGVGLAGAGAGFGCGFGSGSSGCSSTCLTPVERRNMPNPCSHSKYRSPLTAPSFLPVCSSNSIPTHSPGWKCVLPT